MVTSQQLLLAGATLATALMAGLFYAYACSVSPGLNRLSDTAYLEAMQSINRVIQNPVFFAGFFGAAILLPLTTYRQYEQPASLRFWFLLAATVTYLVGVLGITALGNVPLNNALDTFSISSASPQALADQRAAFEAPWNRLNLIRTIAAILSMVFVIGGLFSEQAAIRPAK